jgi:ubiquitin carboxyl-terminal hydrolase L3
MSTKSIKTWFPLESNPVVMNAYVEKMGLDVTEYSFHDVFSTEEWALEMVPRPVVAVLMLFPIKKKTEEHRLEEQAKIESEGQIISPDVYYMKQTVGNACGTVGILHAIGNARSLVKIKDNSYLSRLYNRTAELVPEAIAAHIEADTELEETHGTAAAEGQSQQQEGEVDTHFVCFR